MSASFFSQRGRWFIGIIAAAILAYLGYHYKYGKPKSSGDAQASAAAAATDGDSKPGSDDPNAIEFPRESWQAAGIQLQSAGGGPSTKTKASPAKSHSTKIASPTIIRSSMAGSKKSKSDSAIMSKKGTRSS